MLCDAAMEVRALYSLVNLVYKLTHDIKQRQAAKIIHTDSHGIAWYFPQFHKSPLSFFANSLLCLLFPSFLYVFSSVWPLLLLLSHLRPPTLILCTSLKNCISILPGRIYFTLFCFIYIYIYMSISRELDLKFQLQNHKKKNLSSDAYSHKFQQYKVAPLGNHPDLNMHKSRIPWVVFPQPLIP